MEAEPPIRPEAEAERSEPPRIYMASLSDYNAGRLHGVWIDASQSVDEIGEEIDRMLAASPEPLAEEYAIHDHDGFWPVELSEYESLSDVARLAAGIDEHGRAFAHFAHLLGSGWGNDLERFGDCYLGCWPSMEAYAWSLLEDLGVDVNNIGPPELQPYIRFDTEAFARDLSMEFTTGEDDNGVYVFDL
ncbi:MAG TPA: antirestriction protein ArdA [Acidimicrobiales bacterium]|nr:antirestriction protein ArdA [Acidimicrobiales bacterium]